MQRLFIDYETYYSDECSLKKLTPAEYVTHPDFFVWGASVAIDNGPIRFMWAAQLEPYLRSIDWAQTEFIAHNTLFDGAVHAWYYHLPPPAQWSDTVAMSNYRWEKNSVSLAEMARHYGLPDKGAALAMTKGKRELSADERAAFEAYADHDLDLCREIYARMRPELPEAEMQIIDMTCRMALHPALRCDVAMLDDYRATLRATFHADQARHSEIVLGGLPPELHDDVVRAGHKIFASNVQFIRLLEHLGVDIPTKTRKATKTEIEKKGLKHGQLVVVPGVAKTDEGLLALLEHENPAVVAATEARISAKSRINETRASKFIAVASCFPDHAMPVPLKYCGASTNRDSGAWGMNMQNLPARGKDKTIRASLIAPPGFVVMAADLAQIEPRVLGHLADCSGYRAAFPEGKKALFYEQLASRITGIPIDHIKNPSTERNIGKAAGLGLGYSMGYKKFTKFAQTAAGVTFTEEEAKQVVNTYRREFHEIASLWAMSDDLLGSMQKAKSTLWRHTHNGMTFGPDYIVLPSGRFLLYPNLRRQTFTELDVDGNIVRTYDQMVYGERGTFRGVYGGLLVENCTQALSRDILMDMALRIRDEVLLNDIGERIVNRVHDELVMVVHQDRADEVTERVRAIMSTAPSYMSVPVSCTVSHANNYADVK